MLFIIKYPFSTRISVFLSLSVSLGFKPNLGGVKFTPSALQPVMEIFWLVETFH